VIKKNRRWEVNEEDEKGRLRSPEDGKRMRKMLKS
jgi:hypothetical protein